METSSEPGGEIRRVLVDEWEYQGRWIEEWRQQVREGYSAVKQRIVFTEGHVSVLHESVFGIRQQVRVGKLITPTYLTSRLSPRRTPVIENQIVLIDDDTE